MTNSESLEQAKRDIQNWKPSKPLDRKIINVPWKRTLKFIMKRKKSKEMPT